MNYLGHCFLSFKQPEILVGNIIGDYVKGIKDVSLYPPEVQKGIYLHRKIDEFTDKHPACLQAQNIFKADYNRYSGAIVDVLWDHYLANDPKYFDNEHALLSFTHDTYAQVDQQIAILPEKFITTFDAMKAQNWLFQYRTVKGMEKALNGLSYKALHLGDVSKAYSLFLQHFYELNQRYYEFIEEAMIFVKKQLQDNNIGSNT